MFELFLRKKSMKEFAKEEMHSSRAFLAVFIAAIISQLIIAVLSVGGIVEAPDPTITGIIFGFFGNVVRTFLGIVLGIGFVALIDFIFAKLLGGGTGILQYYYKLLFLTTPFIILWYVLGALGSGFGYGSIIMPIVGIISLIFVLYYIYLKFGLIKNYFNISTIRTILVFILPGLIALVLMVLFGLLLITTIFSAIQTGPSQALATMFN